MINEITANRYLSKAFDFVPFTRAARTKHCTLHDMADIKTVRHFRTVDCKWLPCRTVPLARRRRPGPPWSGSLRSESAMSNSN